MPTLNGLQEEIEKLKERNRKVEADKGWETSWSRKLIIFTLTYIAITIYFFAARLPEPFLNSLVPAAAFVISTMSLPFFKNIWMKYLRKG